ncbi:MAG TPA: DUF4347 domain-containing protein, partial [Gammaproteobacteria bacterium]|nr:DUF4347 domain-containing protein [Gammaproteobacteria bacterium]
MRKTLLGSLTGLLIPFAAYATPVGYGAYQRRQPVSAVSHLALTDLVRPYRPVGAGVSRIVGENELAITSGTSTKELVIIDSAVPDKHILYRAAKPGMEIVEIDSSEPGLGQLVAILARYKNLSALHIVSHARDGELLLGSTHITAEDIKHEIGTFSALNGALREGGDLLLYGCDLAAGKAGMELLEIIHGNTHVDVAASSDKTGSRDLQGDWDLEISAGDIEAKLPFSGKAIKDFSAVLAAANGTYGFQNGWSDSGNTITSTHFTVGAKTTSGASLNVKAYTASPYPAYITYSLSANNYFYVNVDGVNTGSFELTGLTCGEYASGQFTNMHIVGIKRDNSTVTSSTVNGTGSSGESFSFGAGQLTNFSGVQLKAFKLYFDATSAVPSTVPFFEFRTFTIANAQNPPDSDGNVTAGAGVTEPVGLATTVDTVGEAVNVFDFKISDGATSDSYALDVSQIIVNVSGTSTDTERGQITWRLNGPDVDNVTGTYSAATDRITFPGLGISVANGGNQTYTINAYYNNNAGVTDGHTVILSVDGDTNLTVGSLGTQMGSTSAVTNGTGTTVDVAATQLVFVTQPAGSVSGSALTTQPAVAARDAFGNTDINFTETVTLTEASAGSLTNNTQAASSGVATFTNLIYTATSDQQSFTLTANDQDGVGSNLPTADSNPVTSNVVATKLVFDTQPVPLNVASGNATAFTTVPVVSAKDANNVIDTGYGTGISLAEVNGAGSATMSATGDTDGSAATVTITPSSGVSTFTGMQVNYTVSGSGNETFNLRASSGGLSTADSSTITALATPAVTAGNISISGATGTGGAYKIGDTVTATWNNAADGDNNAGVTGVTVNFSEFGGGTAVAATESSGAWTATYPVVAGSINATSRNVSVTATNASGPTTTADNDNATVDNIRPTAGIVVSDTNLIAGETSLVTIT